eukprot:3724691-Pleurochrysis_carterae.AAC.1
MPLINLPSTSFAAAFAQALLLLACVHKCLVTAVVCNKNLLFDAQIAHVIGSALVAHFCLRCAHARRFCRTRGGSPKEVWPRPVPPQHATRPITSPGAALVPHSREHSG